MARLRIFPFRQRRWIRVSAISSDPWITVSLWIPLASLYRAIVGSMSVSPGSSVPFANSLHVLTAHVARSASVLATCWYASLSLLTSVAVSICPRVANWRGCGSCCLVSGGGPDSVLSVVIPWLPSRSGSPLASYMSVFPAASVSCVNSRTCQRLMLRQVRVCTTYVLSLSLSSQISGREWRS